MIKLTVQNLQKKYGDFTVFQKLTFTTSAHVFGIAGSNGSGKSTLLRCLANLLKPTEGSIQWFRGEEKISNHSITQTLGFAAPYVELYEGLSCIENLQLLKRLKRSECDNIDADTHLKQFNAHIYADKLYGELSTGQRQRVKLAASVLHSPDILCLDEPGSNLDKKGKDLIKKTVQQFKTDQKMVILASNQPEELNLCDEQIDLDSRHEPNEI